MTVELFNSDDESMGEFDSPEAAKAHVPHVDDWRPLQDAFSSYNGWDSSSANFGEKPQFKIRAI
jgi:hypothetical protein